MLLDKLKKLMGEEAFLEETNIGEKFAKATYQDAELHVQPLANAGNDGVTSSASTMTADRSTAYKDDSGLITSHEADPPQEMSLEEILARKTSARDSDRRVSGELGPPGDYCPILAVSKFPYRYMVAQSELSEAVSKKFFASEKFWRRLWSVYYVYPPVALGNRPLLVIPSEEVQKLFTQINNEFSLDIDFKSLRSRAGFSIEFEEDGNPLPRFLGLSDSRPMFQSLENNVPRTDYKVKGEETVSKVGDDRSATAWRKKIEAAIDATKNKNKASKEKRKQHRVQMKSGEYSTWPTCFSDWSRQLRRSQRYFGLRTTNAAERKGSLANKSADEQEKINNERALMSMGGVATPNVDLEQPAPHPFDSSVVFISVDVEAYERSHSLITEIGIASLDTLDLVGLAPRKGGVAWMEKVQGRHFLIKENSHLVNHEFISGCPDRFEAQFGVSEMISIHDAPGIVASCFRLPILDKGDARPAPNPLNLADTPLVAQNTGTDGPIEEGQPAMPKSDAGKSSVSHRTIVLVGHDTKTDIDYLRRIGFDATNVVGLLEVLDTSELWRTMKHEEQAASLSTVLYNLGIVGWNLHNAGNDAAYSLQALVGIVVGSLASKEDRVSAAEELIDRAKEEAAERVRDNLDEWSEASAEEGDGGVPSSYVSKSPYRRADGGDTPQRGRGGYGAGGGGRGNIHGYCGEGSLGRGGRSYGQ